MTAKRKLSELMMLFREGNTQHSQKVMRVLLASEGTDWKRWGKPERLRVLSALVFGPGGESPRGPRPDHGVFASSRHQPMRLGGRFDPDLALDDAEPAGQARETPRPSRLPRRPVR